MKRNLERKLEVLLECGDSIYPSHHKNKVELLRYRDKFSYIKKRIGGKLSEKLLGGWCNEFHKTYRKDYPEAERYSKELANYLKLQITARYDSETRNSAYEKTGKIRKDKK